MTTPLENAIFRVMVEAVQELQLYIESKRRESFCSSCGRFSHVELEQRATGLCRALSALSGQSSEWWWEHLFEIAQAHRPERSDKGLVIKRLKEQALKELYAKVDAGPKEPVQMGTCQAPGCSNPVFTPKAQFCSMRCKNKKKRG